MFYRPWFRKLGQLWYEIFKFSCNKSPEELKELIAYAKLNKLIVAMHPHGVVPFHGVLWSAYCDQYLTDHSNGESLYGFGAVANSAMRAPLLRNIMGWLSCGPADYQALKAGLKDVSLNI